MSIKLCFNTTARCGQWSNTFGLFSVCIVLTMAFIAQLIQHELPCPLCLLQRLAFIAIGLGFMLNVIWERQSTHYGIIILSCLFGLFTATRQVLLHITPGSGSYGPPLFGLHFYTWSDIAFIGYLGFTGLILLIQSSSHHQDSTVHPNLMSKLLTLWFFIIVIGNVLTTIGLCGIGICPDNPVRYLFGS